MTWREKGKYLTLQARTPIENPKKAVTTEERHQKLQLHKDSESA